MTKNITGLISLIIIFFAGNDPALSRDYWIRQSSPSTKNFKDCFFINNTTGWISGDSGTIIKTTNEGQSWTIQQTGIFNNIQNIFFINERLGWAIAYEVFPDSNSFLGTRMLKTTDGGNIWTTYMYPDSNKFMRSIYFLDSLTGFMVGAPIIIVRTSDAGLRWGQMDTDTSLQLGLPLENIKFINNHVGYACGGFRDIAGAMWTSTNGGFNWTGLIIAPEPFMDLYIFDPEKAMAVGGDFEYGSSFVNTTNQGLVWNYDTLGTFGVASAVDFRTPYEGWITLGIAQKFTYSLDSGKTWNAIYSPDSIPVNDVQFTDSLHGWAVGYNGAILKYNPLTVNISNEHGNFLPDQMHLYQNYPNPFNPNTTINYRLSIFGHVSLKIYDVLGNEVADIVNESQKPGAYSVEFFADHLSSGVYYYKLISGENSIARKMLILK